MGSFPTRTARSLPLLHYGHVPSAENNKVFGQAQSFVPGPPTNIQFMVAKDSTKYRRDGRLGLRYRFVDGKTRRCGVDEILLPLPQCAGQGVSDLCLHALRTVEPSSCRAKLG